MTEDEIHQIMDSLNAKDRDDAQANNTVLTINPAMTLLEIIANGTTSSSAASVSSGVVASNSRAGNSRSGRSQPGRPSSKAIVTLDQLAHWDRHGTPGQVRAIRVGGLKLYVYLMDGYNSFTKDLATVLLLQLGGPSGMSKYLFTTCSSLILLF